METWLLSLVLTLAISLSALVPGTLDARLGTDLTREARLHIDPAAVAVVHVQGDPVLELPWGIVPKLDVRLTGLHARGLALSEVRIGLAHVHVSPWVVLAHQPPQLLEPAQARLAVRLGRADLQAALDQQLATLTPGRFEVDLPLLGHVAPALSAAKLQLGGGRVEVSGDVVLKPGAAARRFSLSAALITLDGTQVILSEPRLSLAGVAVPVFLLQPLVQRLPALLKLTDLPLPPGTWKMESPAIATDSVELRASGTVVAL